MNTIAKMMFNLWILPAFGKFVAASSKILTDMDTAINAYPYSTTAQAAAQNPNGPIVDIAGTLKSVKKNFEAAVFALNYILTGTQSFSSTPTAPTGGVLAAATDATSYNALAGIYQLFT